MELGTGLLNHTGDFLQDFLTVSGVFIITYLALTGVKSLLLKKLKKAAGKTPSKLDDTILHGVEEIQWPFYLFLSLYAAVQFTQAPVFIGKTILYAFVVVATYYAVNLTQNLIDYSKNKVIEKRVAEEKTADVSLINTLTKFIKTSLWLIAVLLIISNMGYDITALLAGLGIGGIAIALALQNILDDIFSSLSIYFDKPFVVGDFIIIGDDLGVVNKIGIKTTRIQHLQGQELVVSNKELTSTRIHNYGKMEKRRISFNFGVTYETPSEKLDEIPRIVKDVVESVELTTFDRAHFKKFGDYSLNYEVVYYIATSDYNKYMDIQQAINVGIMKRFQKEDIGFAYPTQTIELKK